VYNLHIVLPLVFRLHIHAVFICCFLVLFANSIAQLYSHCLWFISSYTSFALINIMYAAFALSILKHKSSMLFGLLLPLQTTEQECHVGLTNKICLSV